MNNPLKAKVIPGSSTSTTSTKVKAYPPQSTPSARPSLKEKLQAHTYRPSPSSFAGRVTEILLVFDEPLTTHQIANLCNADKHNSTSKTVDVFKIVKTINYLEQRGFVITKDLAPTHLQNKYGNAKSYILTDIVAEREDGRLHTNQQRIKEQRQARRKQRQTKVISGSSATKTQSTSRAASQSQPSMPLDNSLRTRAYYYLKARLRSTTPEHLADFLEIETDQAVNLMQSIANYYDDIELVITARVKQ